MTTSVYDEEKRMKRFFLWCAVVLIGATGYSLYKGNSEKKAKAKEQARQEQRAQEFAEYIFEDVRSWVKDNAGKENLRWAINMYKEDPKAFKKGMDYLLADSAKYADAIIRDADYINWLDETKDRTVSFQEAMKIIESQQPTVKQPVTRAVRRMGVSHGEEVVAGIDYEPTGETRNAPNHSVPRIMKINKKHLKDISLDLAVQRMAVDKARK